jgi:hypothetical protein
METRQEYITLCARKKWRIVPESLICFPKQRNTFIWNGCIFPLYIYVGTMANCIKTLGAYYGRPTWFEKVFPSSRPWSVRTVAPPKLTLGTDLKTKFVTMTVLTVAAFVYIIFMLIYVKIVRLL